MNAVKSLTMFNHCQSDLPETNELDLQEKLSTLFVDNRQKSNNVISTAKQANTQRTKMKQSGLSNSQINNTKIGVKTQQSILENQKSKVLLRDLEQSKQLSSTSNQSKYQIIDQSYPSPRTMQSQTHYHGNPSDDLTNDNNNNVPRIQVTKPTNLSTNNHIRNGPATSPIYLSTIQDPASQKLKWQKPPLSVLVVKKMFDDNIISPFVELVSWLIKVKKMIVFLEHKVLGESLLRDDLQFSSLIEKLKTFEEGENLTGKVDFIVCLGGDGTLLHASSLFQQSVPPVMAFHLGSLGFLTPFEFHNFRDQVTHVLEGNAALTLRSRLKCVVCKDVGGQCSEEPSIKTLPLRQHSFTRSQILTLNEVVIDRGPCPFLCNLDLFIEGRMVTSVQGDGLIISTPTGSTAYAVAAGASMMHPNVPSIMITPICPHSLSFRPIVVPAGVEIKVIVSPDARNSAWVSFDGRNRQEIHQGDSVRITTASYPIPSVCKTDQIDDWFSSLAECLHWNVRKTQQPLSSRNSMVTLDSDTESNHSSR